MSAETSPAIKAAVIAQRLSGSRKSQIAKDLGVSKPTVYKILGEAQVDELSNHAKSILYGALPDAANTIARKVRKNSVDAWELLDRSGAMPKSVPVEQTNVAVGVKLEGMPGLGQAEGSQPITVNQSERPPEDGV